MTETPKQKVDRLAQELEKAREQLAAEESAKATSMVARLNGLGERLLALNETAADGVRLGVDGPDDGELPSLSAWVEIPMAEWLGGGNEEPSASLYVQIRDNGTVLHEWGCDARIHELENLDMLRKTAAVFNLIAAAADVVKVWASAQQRKEPTNG